jgi:hypothetical protein
VPLGHFHVIDRKWIYIGVLLISIFGLNVLWQSFLPAMNMWADSICRSIVLLGGGAWIAYKAELSPEINQQIVQTLNIKH